MIPFKMAMEPKSQGVVRGVLLEAIYQIWESGSFILMGTIKLADAPYQKNNMTQWLEQVIRQEPDKELLKALRSNYEAIEFVVNHGRGALKGRGAHRNFFTYHFGTWKVEVFILTEAHQAVHYRKVKSGEYTPKPKVETSDPEGPYISARTGCIMVPIELYGETAWQEYPVAMHETYYKEHPELRGNLPRLDL